MSFEVENTFLVIKSGTQVKQLQMETVKPITKYVQKNTPTEGRVETDLYLHGVGWVYEHHIIFNELQHHIYIFGESHGSNGNCPREATDEKKISIVEFLSRVFIEAVQEPKKRVELFLEISNTFLGRLESGTQPVRTGQNIDLIAKNFSQIFHDQRSPQDLYRNVYGHAFDTRIETDFVKIDDEIMEITDFTSKCIRDLEYIEREISERNITDQQRLDLLKKFFRAVTYYQENYFNKLVTHYETRTGSKEAALQMDKTLTNENLSYFLSKNKTLADQIRDNTIKDLAETFEAEKHAFLQMRKLYKKYDENNPNSQLLFLYLSNVKDMFFYNLRYGSKSIDAAALTGMILRFQHRETNAIVYAGFNHSHSLSNAIRDIFKHVTDVTLVEDSLNHCVNVGKIMPFKFYNMLEKNKKPSESASSEESSEGGDEESESSEEGEDMDTSDEEERGKEEEE